MQGDRTGSPERLDRFGALCLAHGARDAARSGARALVHGTRMQWWLADALPWAAHRPGLAQATAGRAPSTISARSKSNADTAASI